MRLLNQARTAESFSRHMSFQPKYSVTTSGRSDARSRSSHSRPCSDVRSEEHTSELQSRSDLVCRLLLEKKKKKNKTIMTSVKCTKLRLCTVRTIQIRDCVN